MISAVIIEDEPIFQEILKNAIKETGFSIRVDGVCNSKREAKKILPSVRPQLIFLDVELADGKGIDLLNELESTDFEIIFTTSHDKYAISAIKNNAADYLLKPIKEKELKKAIEKVAKRLEEKETLKQAEQLQGYLDKIKQEQQQDSKLMVPTKDGMIFLKVNDIVRLQSESNYTLFFLVGNKKVLVAKTLKNFEEKLLSYNFLRIHQSHLINLAHMKEIDHGDNLAIMTDGSKVEISKRKKKEFLDSLEKNNKTIA
ncbi:MAG: response regulator transcription factor [Chitinophagales bacterium]|nr:response regulator transcription factor [Chitinophagales bacterium]HMW12353.1 LytTR family DNA-binding domain-containing protein [Chitinophagales bacterium]HMX59964.1 LytTR family DNA-binding domain-containing protein [Chitinophagales bacterium]HMY22300.1 LytTR family DNA-binding domain-containing protein [Chitinophagales bacterium]HMZ33733.1 LytTR family DNA-binding domain-containing protein [Chitinophagales bacterium]